MPDRILHIFDETIEATQTSEISHLSVVNEGDNVIYIYDQGKRGQTGPQGPPGYSGAGEPFFVITSGSLYATTASIAILASISSSLIPLTGSGYFNIGASNSPWNNVYLTGSIYINSIPVIQYMSADQQKFLITSASITASAINERGVFITSNFNFLPPPVTGGIIKSGSDFFVGI